MPKTFEAEIAFIGVGDFPYAIWDAHVTDLGNRYEINGFFVPLEEGDEEDALDPELTGTVNAPKNLVVLVLNLPLPDEDDEEEAE